MRAAGMPRILARSMRNVTRHAWSAHRQSRPLLLCSSAAIGGDGGHARGSTPSSSGRQPREGPWRDRGEERAPRGRQHADERTSSHAHEPHGQGQGRRSGGGRRDEWDGGERGAGDWGRQGGRSDGGGREEFGGEVQRPGRDWGRQGQRQGWEGQREWERERPYSRSGGRGERWGREEDQRGSRGGERFGGGGRGGGGSGRGGGWRGEQRWEEEEEEEEEEERWEEEGGPPGSREFFVTCHPGLEGVVARELRDLGIEHVREGKAGVTFWSAAFSDGYRACLWLRSAIRVLLLLSRQPLHTDPGRGYRSGDSVYEATRQAGDWPALIPPGHTFAVDSRVWSCTDLTSTALASTRVKDAICDSLRDAGRGKPSPPAPGEQADVPLYCSCFRDVLALYRDLCGMSLHRRGYRDAMHRSPLNEAAAAGILLMAGWKELSGPSGAGNDALLVDPMCGSGTLLSEAVLIARNTAPGLLRPSSAWPFARWPDFDPSELKAAVTEAHDLARPWRGTLLGNDVHEGALALARRDASALDRALGASQTVEASLRYSCGDCRDWVLPSPPSLLVTNPPWGMRLAGDGGEGGARGSSSSSGSSRGDSEAEGQPRGREWTGEGGGRGRGQRESLGLRPLGLWPGGEDSDSPLSEMSELEGSWRALSDFLRQQCGGASAFVLSGNKDAFNYLRMKPSRKETLTVGGVETRLYEFKVLPPLSKEEREARGPPQRRRAGAAREQQRSQNQKATVKPVASDSYFSSL